jgi:hypothetical protein
MIYFVTRMDLEEKAKSFPSVPECITQQKEKQPNERGS